MKRTIIIIVILVLAIGGFIGYRMFDEKTPDVTDQKPDVVITARELIAAFDRDTASASKMYIDKVIEVSGTVNSVDTSGSVVLGEPGSASSVTVSLDRRHINDHKNLKIGSAAVLQGICSGYSKAGGDPDDLLAGLGTTVELNFAGVKDKK
jgi:hypothetical protein